jgi:hypothetical protein
MLNLKNIFEKEVQTEPLSHMQFKLAIGGVTTEKDKAGNKHTVRPSPCLSWGRFTEDFVCFQVYHLNVMFTPKIHGELVTVPVIWHQSHRFSDWDSFHSAV